MEPVNITLSRIGKLELLVYGYINDTKLSDNFPDVIKEIIIEFTKFYFNWKHSEYHDCYGKAPFEFFDGNPARIARLNYGDLQWFAFLAMNDVLSLDVCRKFEWELEMLNQNDGTVGFQFGFVEHPLTESVKDWDVHFGYGDTKYKQFGVYISSGYDHFKRRGRSHKDGSKIIGNTVTGGWKSGDRFGLIVDFESNTITLMYNYKDMGIIFSDIPNKLHAAISVFSATELICTKANFVK